MTHWQVAWVFKILTWVNCSTIMNYRSLGLIVMKLHAIRFLSLSGFRYCCYAATCLKGRYHNEDDNDVKDWLWVEQWAYWKPQLWCRPSKQPSSIDNSDNTWTLLWIKPLCRERTAVAHGERNRCGELVHVAFKSSQGLFISSSVGLLYDTKITTDELRQRRVPGLRDRGARNQPKWVRWEY